MVTNMQKEGRKGTENNCMSIGRTAEQTWISFSLLLVQRSEDVSSTRKAWLHDKVAEMVR